MKTLSFSFTLFFICIQLINAQTFNQAHWDSIADRNGLNAAERAELVGTQKNLFEQEHQHGDHKDLVWVTFPTTKSYGSGVINSGACTNMDFESGSFSGWTRSTGWNPLTSTVGCCGTINGDQTIMSGSGVDPYGGFPVVYPDGGVYSLRLGSTAIGGKADRISQTFFVNASNANFTFRYALVLNDAGHAPSQQAHFDVEILDTLGNPLSCNANQLVIAGPSAGLNSSSLTANAVPVQYKDWTSVALDLTPNIGQNITIRFTVYDCAPAGHFAYVYLDGTCSGNPTNLSFLSCQSTSAGMCAPAGYSTTVWNGPGISSSTIACITPTTAGTYTCVTTTNAGCTGPTYTYNFSYATKPQAAFSYSVSDPCSKQYTFTSLSTATVGTITGQQWFFGDGTSAYGLSTVSHSYASGGTYNVKLRIYSSTGCTDSTITTLNISSVPNPQFFQQAYYNCVGGQASFVNTSTIATGSISSYVWYFGDGSTSTQTNTLKPYSSPGIYDVTLQATSSLSCTASISHTISIYPNPVLSISASGFCFPSSTSFSSTATVSSGSIDSLRWNFGDGSTTISFNPTHTYSLSGLYTVTVTAYTDAFCSTTTTAAVGILSNPTASFNAAPASPGNSCTPAFNFTNTSAAGSLASYSWNFGGSSTSTLSSPSYTFPGAGTYSVTLFASMGGTCSSSNTQTLVVQPYPIINFTLSNACAQSSLGIQTSTIGGNPISSYNWNFGDPASLGLNTSGLASPFHTYNSSGNYTIQLTLSNPSGCQTNTVLQVTVFSLPTISVNSGSICNGANFTIVPSGANFYNYQGGTNIVSPHSNTSYTVSGTNSLGCSSASPAICTVSVIPLPTLSISNGTICNGSSYTLNPSGAYSYSVQGGSFVVNPNTSTSYTVTGFSQEGCQGTNPVACFLTVNPLPTVAVNSGSICAGSTFSIVPSGATAYTISGGASLVSPSVSSNYSVIGVNTTGCTNSAVCQLTVYPNPTISINSGTSCAGDAFILQPGGGISYSYSTGSATVYPNSSQSFTVIGANAQGCTNTAIGQITVSLGPTILVNSGTVCAGQSFTFFPLGGVTYSYSSGSPVVYPSSSQSYTISGSNTLGCVGTAISDVTVFPKPTIAAVNGSICVGASFTMTPSGANSFTYSSGSAVVQPSNTSTYTIAGTSSLGCTGQTVVTVTVNALPSLTVTSMNQDMCAGESTTLLASGATSYTWNSVFPASFYIVSPLSNTNYTLAGTDGNHCLSQTVFTQTVSSCLGIHEINKAGSSVIIYPNPSTGKLEITSAENMDLFLIDALGRTIRSLFLNESNMRHAQVEELPAGIYFITDPGGSYRSSKILIE